MILRRIIDHVKKEHWTAIAIDLVIVILGVFIGLQANNWNEARNDRGRERTYLERLRADSDANVKTLEAYVDDRRRDGHTLTILALALQRSGQPPSEEALQRPLCRWGAAPLPALRQGTYDELVSSGALNLIRDEKLRILLADYSTAEQRSAYVSTLLPAVQRAAEPLDIYRRWSVTEDPAAGTNGDVKCKFDLAGMQRDARMASVVAQLVRFQKLHEFYRNAELEKARALEMRLNQLVGNV